LFEWTAGGHRPIYVRRLVEALRPSTDLLLALPQVTLDAIGDLNVDTLSLGEPRPQLRGRLRRRSILAEEVDRLRDVASRADQTVHLFADHALFRLATTKRLPGRISLVVYYARGHYAAAYGTRLPLADRAVAHAKEWAVVRWRRRPDAHVVFTLDEEAARRWGQGRGAPAHWLPEPPVATLPYEPSTNRDGCILYGALAPRKGIDLLTHALTIEPTRIRLVLAGGVDPPDYLSELRLREATMRASGVDIELRTHQHSELEGLRALAEARCALLPYPRHPGMSRVLLEACSVGTPVVVDRFGLLGHLVQRHGLGLAVDSADPRALRGAILSLADADDTGAYAEALAAFAARFTPERFRASLLDGLDISLPGD
jgi:hypothetical protein